MHSEQPATLRAEYAGLAVKLDLPEQEAQDQSITVEAAKEWLRRNKNWLLIFDNAPNAESVREYIPSGSVGHIIITSRDSSWRGVATSLSVKVLPKSEAVEFILNRTGQKDAETAATLAETLGCLPLALEQSSAYIDACGCPLSHYANLFQESKEALLQEGKLATDYPDTVATTWELSFQQVERENPAAAALLRLCAFFAPDDIPLQVIKDGAKFLPAPLASAVTNPLAFDKSLAALRHYSLVERKAELISVHRLVQAVTQHRMGDEAVKEWTEAAVQILNDAFPEDSLDFRTWKTCSLLLPHALAALSDAETQRVDANATAGLLNMVGGYFFGSADFKQAEMLFKRAIDISQFAFGSNHPKVAVSINNLGLVLEEFGDLESAKSHLERALAIDEAARPLDDLRVAIRLSNLGNILYKLGDLEGAKARHERSLAITKDTLGDKHPDVATVANNLGFVLKELRDFDGARTYIEYALAIDETVLGPNHPVVARDVNNLGLVLKELGDFVGARTHLERALRILRETLGEDHPNTVMARDNLEALGGS